MNPLLKQLVEDEYDASPEDLSDLTAAAKAPLKKPYTHAEILAMYQANNEKSPHIICNLAFSFSELLGIGIDYLSDRASEEVTGNICGLEDIDYQPVAVDSSGGIIVEVSAVVSDYLMDIIIEEQRLERARQENDYWQHVED